MKLPMRVARIEHIKIVLGNRIYDSKPSEVIYAETNM